MNLSVGEYIVLEGLAESFATEQYGAEFMGPWVTEITGDNLARSRTIIGTNLDVRGFAQVRPFIFGGTLAGEGEARELPHGAGYAIGYRVVQAYCTRTGQSTVQAMLTPAAEIIEQSGYFG